MLGWQGMVFNGEYAIPETSLLPPGWQPAMVLDLGANHGAYAVFACTTWPNCHYAGYEPNQANWDLLRRSIAPFGLDAKPEDKPRVSVWRSCVTCSSEPSVHVGRRQGGNEGEWQLAAVPGPDTIEVPNVHANSLPACDLLKVDIEGAEEGVIRAYLATHKPRVVVYEYHSSAIFAALATQMVGSGYCMLRGGQGRAVPCGVGVAVWVLLDTSTSPTKNA